MLISYFIVITSSSEPRLVSDEPTPSGYSAAYSVKLLHVKPYLAPAEYALDGTFSHTYERPVLSVTVTVIRTPFKLTGASIIYRGKTVSSEIEILSNSKDMDETFLVLIIAGVEEKRVKIAFGSEKITFCCKC